MGYPMTYIRFISRNSLVGNGYGHDGYPKATLPVSATLLAGDLRRLEKDQRDADHLAAYAALAGVTVDQAKTILDAFFEDTGDRLHWYHASVAQRDAAIAERKCQTCGAVGYHYTGCANLRAQRDANRS